MEMTAKGLGMTAVVDADGHAVGIFTDGDLRRCLDRGIDVRQATIEQVMTPFRQPAGDINALRDRLLDLPAERGVLIRNRAVPGGICHKQLKGRLHPFLRPTP